MVHNGTSSSQIHDEELELVVSELLTLDPNGVRIASVLRETLDQLYDGQHSGRYRWEQLHKTEKTHCGTLVEINLHREFRFTDGQELDYCIQGVDVDCKYSQRMGGWMIPPEARGKLCLVVTADDERAEWSAGIVRATEDRLNFGSNRDAKATLNLLGRKAVRWLFEGAELPPNALLQLSADNLEAIFSPSSGQRRVNELFRRALGMRISRAVVATVAQQNDYMKRVRGNGGARTHLRPEGILILGQYGSHVQVARALAVPGPQKGEFVSVRVVPSGSSGGRAATIEGTWWRVAHPEDPPHPAPLLPDVRR